MRTMLETALSLHWCIGAALNTAVILMLTAVFDFQSRVSGPTAISQVSFRTVMSVSLGLTAAAHGVGSRVDCWSLGEDFDRGRCTVC